MLRPIDRVVASNILNLRLERRMTQRDLSRITRIDRALICKIEIEERRTQVYQLVRFAIAFKVPVEKLLE